MAASIYMPDVVTEIAFNSGYLTPAASRTWTDVSAYVEAQEDISISRGRPDQFDTVQASQLSLTLDNRDGRFTPENAAGAYYPNVKKGRPIRVRATIPGNLLSANNASLETSVGSWVAGGAAVPAVSQSPLRAVDGTKSLRMTWPAGAGTSSAQLSVSGLTASETYTFSAYLYADSGAPDVRLEVAGVGVGSSMTTKDAWVRVSFTFTATGSSHTLQVARVSGTSGNAWADAMMLQTGSTATDFTTNAPTTKTLFTGYVDEWPVVWPDGTDAMSTVTVTAMSRMARLGRTAEFRSIVEEEYLYDEPVLYFPLGEPDGSTTAGNIAPGRSEALSVVQVGSGGTVTFGQGTGPGTDDLTAPVFAPVDEFNGMRLRTDLLAQLPSSTLVIQLEAWIVYAAGGGTGARTVLSLTDDADAGMQLRVVPSTGKAQAGAPVAGASVVSASSSVADGNLHHLVATYVLSGSNIQASITVDGTTTTGASTAWPFVSGGVPYFPGFLRINLGGAQTADGLYQGTIAHAAIYAGTSAVSGARLSEHYLSGSTGFASEASGARIARYARLAGIPDAEIAAEVGLSTSMAHLDITGKSPLEAMQEVATTEDGVLFDAGDGTLTFHARSHRYNSTSAFTLSRNAGDIEEGFTPTLDDQNLTNDMTASRPGGITVRSVNQPSIDEYGYYRESVEILTTSDNEVQSRADWQVNRFGTPRVTVPNVETDLLSASATVQAALLAADIGTRFTLSNLPSQAPASTQDYFIEGITYTIGPQSFDVAFNTSVADYANVWTLDSASFSQLDSTTVLAY